MPRSPALLLCAALFVGAGTLHLATPEPFERIVPAWVPSARAAVLLSGVAELLGGLGLLLPATRPAARWGLGLLLVAVFPANVEMAQHAQRFPVPAWVLWARLPLQPLLLWWVWQVGRAAPPAPRAQRR
ncbi:DoxX family protein [Deinococcus sonorensis]|uniref:DoxX family protein n=2 Tax=Deinococcus sonorensis TaxID=309891 RepID=A0AAU7U911_9DEIO